VSLELLVRGRAKADIRRAAKSYERQKHRNIRHAITRDFSYGVFYRIRGNKISVFGVLHLHRDDVRFRTRPRIRGRLPALVALPSLADHVRRVAGARRRWQLLVWTVHPRSDVRQQMDHQISAVQEMVPGRSAKRGHVSGASRSAHTVVRRTSARNGAPSNPGVSCRNPAAAAVGVGRNPHAVEQMDRVDVAFPLVRS